MLVPSINETHYGVIVLGITCWGRNDHEKITHFRLLYGVVIVLTTCLLIVGGAYRLQNREAQRDRKELSSLIQRQQAEIAALRKERDAERATPKKIYAYDHCFGTDESASPDRRYLAEGIKLLDEGPKDDQKARKDAAPWDKSNSSTNPPVIEEIGEDQAVRCLRPCRDIIESSGPTRIKDQRPYASSYMEYYTSLTSDHPLQCPKPRRLLPPDLKDIQ